MRYTLVEKYPRQRAWGVVWDSLIDVPPEDWVVSAPTLQELLTLFNTNPIFKPGDQLFNETNTHILTHK